MFLMVALLINGCEFPPAVKIIVPLSHLIFIQPQTLPAFSSSELCGALHPLFSECTAVHHLTGGGLRRKAVLFVKNTRVFLTGRG